MSRTLAHVKRLARTMSNYELTELARWIRARKKGRIVSARISRGVRQARKGRIAELKLVPVGQPVKVEYTQVGRDSWGYRTKTKAEMELTVERHGRSFLYGRDKAGRLHKVAYRSVDRITTPFQALVEGTPKGGETK